MSTLERTLIATLILLPLLLSAGFLGEWVAATLSHVALTVGGVR